MTEKQPTGSRARVEPLFAALEEPEAGQGASPAPPGRSRLGWKLLWAALVLLGLVAIVLNQAF